ncbi:MAG TPA: thioredoxin family protein [Bellilinea sp.]|nr:thioredoxin family protein [Bellilinea sp.]
MLTVKILGTGCPSCRHLEAETRLALDMMETPIAYEMVKITDFMEIVNYGVLSVPALIMNDRLLSTGRIPKREQIVQWALEAEKNPS